MSLLIKNGTIVNKDKVFKADVLVNKDLIVEVSSDIKTEAKEIIDAGGKYIFPGFIDMHTHLRVPGREDKEDLFTGSKAAAKGGFTTIMCMPNTEPAIDDYETAKWIIDQAKDIKLVDIIPIGAITKARAGVCLSEFGRLKEAGCIALSDDGCSVKNGYILRKALEYAKLFNMLIISHCEDEDLAAKGVVRESNLSAEMGLPAWPSISESITAFRDIEIASYLDVPIHIAHVSSKRTLEIIKEAKARGVKVTAETCPHYFSLSIGDIKKNFNSLYKVNPPLGTEEDVQAVKQALRDGVLDCIATDHAPHTHLEKEVDFYQANFGMIGLEFAFSLTLNLVKDNITSLSDITAKLSANPAKILSLHNKGEVSQGFLADLVIADLDADWKVEALEIASKSKNTPFLGKTLTGKILYTLHKGKTVYKS